MIDKQTLDDLTSWITQEVKLPIHAERELQLTALLSAVLDALTQIGPAATKRVLIWAFLRYGIKPGYGVYGEWEIRDRRPKSAAPPPEPPPPVAPPAPALVCPVCERLFTKTQGLAAHLRIAHDTSRAALAAVGGGGGDE